MPRNNIYLPFFLIILTAVIVMVILWQLQKNPWDNIKDFNSCVKAGYPAIQSYPPECSLPNGRFFIQQVVPEK